MTVSKWGKVADCEIIASSGHNDLDEIACDSIGYRARFRAATDANANPTKGEYITQVGWLTPANYPTRINVPYPKRPFPITFSTKYFPSPPQMAGYYYQDYRPKIEDFPQQAIADWVEGNVELALHISPKGELADCKIVKSSENQALDAASCGYVASKAKFRPAKDANGDFTDGRITTGVAWTLPPKVENPEKE